MLTGLVSDQKIYSLISLLLTQTFPHLSTALALCLLDRPSCPGQTAGEGVGAAGAAAAAQEARQESLGREQEEELEDGSTEQPGQHPAPRSAEQ